MPYGWSDLVGASRWRAPMSTQEAAEASAGAEDTPGDAGAPSSASAAPKKPSDLVKKALTKALLKRHAAARRPVRSRASNRRASALEVLGGMP